MAGKVFFSVTVSLDGFMAPDAVPVEYVFSPEGQNDPRAQRWMTKWSELQAWLFPQRAVPACPRRARWRSVRSARQSGPSDDERSQAIAIRNVHCNYHRPHGASGGQPPASRLETRVTNVRPSYN